ncbi:hypothetical protein KR222_008589 [Zaprionus bogoriensis]|nr:hypothetical protein KR222_008589 [Zaprionus bogoriensis]
MGIISTTLRKPQVDMDSAQAQFVRDAIANNKVTIFSKTYCPYCSMAKEPFRKLNINALIIELDGRKDGNEIQNVLGELTGARTVSLTALSVVVSHITYLSKQVPRVFIDGKFVGGGTDIKRMYEMGELQKYFE